MGITAAIVGGLGAVGSIGGALIGSNASQNASNQQVAAQQAGLQQQRDLFDTGMKTATGALNPFITAGQSILPTLQRLITPGPDQTAALSQTPGFQFASQYGTKAATNALSARTGASAGPLATAISQYNSGLAQNTFMGTVNALQGFAGMGAGAAGTLGTAALNGSINAGNSQANTLGNIGTAQAAGTLGSANALSGGLSGATGAATNAMLFSRLLNPAASNGGIYGSNGLASGQAFNNPTSNNAFYGPLN